MFTCATSSYGQYTTGWVGNTFGDLANYVGNCARSMWVSPEGVIYTASMWDEKSRNIGIYQNGTTIGAMGGTKDSQGSAIGGDSTYIFTAQQAPNVGKLGRYNRSTKTRDLLFSVSTGTGDCIKGIVVLNGEVFVSDFAGNYVRVYTTGGLLLREWAVTEPGAIAIESTTGYVWVAQMSTGKLRRYSNTGTASTVISMSTSSRPSALSVDNFKGQLLVGDQGPDMNIKIYTNLTGTPTLQSTFGVAGGYLQGTTIKGQAGDKRFTRVVGVGRDQAGNLYVLNNPWGGTWDLGRNGATDIHCYSSSNILSWTLQQLNFEGIAAPDPGSDGLYLYSGNIVYKYSGTNGANYIANTIDPFRYPSDPRLNVSDPYRDEHFGHIATVGDKRILVVNGQNPDVFYSFYFNSPTDGWVAIPGDKFTSVRYGFNMDNRGNIWLSTNGTTIQYYPLTGFATSGKPIWGTVVSTPVPTSIARLNRIEYIPQTDQMILAGGSTDWILMGNRIEVYNGWKAGNNTTPNQVITLTRGQAKAMTAAGNYVFVGYLTSPIIDAFNINTGSLELSMTSSSSAIYVGNDLDSQYGINAIRKSTGEYIITKDDYNASKVVIHRWTPATLANAQAVTTDDKNSVTTFTVFPNLANMTLQVNLEKDLANDVNFNIFDYAGRIVKQVRISDTKQLVVEIKDLNQGIYILTVTEVSTGRLIGTHKFIKQ